MTSRAVPERRNQNRNPLPAKPQVDRSSLGLHYAAAGRLSRYLVNNWPFERRMIVVVAKPDNAPHPRTRMTTMFASETVALHPSSGT